MFNIINVSSAHLAIQLRVFDQWCRRVYTYHFVYLLILAHCSWSLVHLKAISLYLSGLCLILLIHPVFTLQFNFAFLINLDYIYRSDPDRKHPPWGSNLHLISHDKRAKSTSRLQIMWSSSSTFHYKSYHTLLIPPPWPLLPLIWQPPPLILMTETDAQQWQPHYHHPSCHHLATTIINDNNSNLWCSTTTITNKLSIQILITIHQY